jgi:type IX secretion system PorP/SprF family membrane protein
MMKKLILFILFSWLFFTPFLKGQDIHFSQFLAAPSHLNPALTGDFNGNFRFIGNHRTQWRSVTTPYQTYALAADAREMFNLKGFHGGVVIYNDKAGDARYGTFQCNVSMAYDLYLSDKGRKKLTIGIQPGFTQRSINSDALNFDNQFKGDKFNPANNSGENFSRNSFSHVNIGTGLTYGVMVNRDLKFSTGVAVYNLTAPNQSFLNNQQIRLDPRYSIYGRAEITLYNDWSLLPSAMVMVQGKYREILVGSGARYNINIRGNDLKSITFGTWYRAGDAGFIMAGADYKGVNVGLSYDFNFSGLVPASNYRGGFELSMIYILKIFEPVRPAYKFCPTFI